MSPSTPLPRMAPWELLVVWITMGTALGTGVGWGIGHVRWGALGGAATMVAIGSFLELVQWCKERS